MAKKYLLVVYEGPDRLWRWRLESPQGDLMALSGKGYAHETNMYRALRKTWRVLLGKSYRTHRTTFIP